MLRNYLVLILLLLTLSWGSSPAQAQTSYNRWDATPVTTPKPTTSTAQRGAQLARAKAQQDSVRRGAYWNNVLPLKRGIGQRMRTQQLQPEDAGYFDFMRRSILYPVEALRAQTGGTIWLRLSVDATGRVTQVTIAESTIPSGAGGEATMKQQAREVVQHLRFEPSAAVTEEEVKMSYVIQ
ncbi:TonB family protein [Hymenobacter sediminis]|uniref:TonB family protein n=1 Tax=Hymenobacter sediminis TaxID=2218621 RepID=UPI000DA667CE|nr:TonB family protein [Hymenobacter sediminis]RPD45889.1 TonB family protein [Hymenobacter sediminis]